MRISLLILLFTLCNPALASATCEQADATGAAGKMAPFTPARDSAERKEILEPLRIFVKKMSDLDVIFVVRHLKADCDWAWIETEPESADGIQHYEPINALLARNNGIWRYVESPPEWAICEQDPDCVDESRYFRKLAARHPGLRLEIFPSTDRQP